MSCHGSLYCDEEGCHVIGLSTVTRRVSSPVSVYCDGSGCHVMCLYTVTRRGVMSWVSIL